MNRLKHKFWEIFEELPERQTTYIKRLCAKTIKGGQLNGFRLYTPWGGEHYFTGTYEIPIQSALAEYLNAGDVLWDVGSNIGFFSMLGAKLIGPTGHVYAFEPVPKNFKAIRLNIRLNNIRNITLFPIALYDHDGVEEIWITKNIGGATLTLSGSIPPDIEKKMAVKTASADKMIVGGDLQPPSLIKIDVEGAEIQVLRGMQNTLVEYKPIIIYEIDDGNEKKFLTKIDAVMVFLDSIGYEIFALNQSYPNQKWHTAHFVAKAR